MPSLRVDFFKPFRSALTLVFFIQRRHIEVFHASYCGFAGFQGEAKMITNAVECILIAAQDASPSLLLSCAFYCCRD